jgi:hypothetical protein
MKYHSYLQHVIESTEPGELADQIIEAMRLYATPKFRRRTLAREVMVMIEV